MASFAVADAVIARTGIKPEDLGQTDQAQQQAFLTDLLAEVSDLVAREVGRDYPAEFEAGTISLIPAGLKGIVADICADAIRTMVATRQTPIVRIDDFAVTILRSKMFSEDVRQRLRLYARQRGVGTIRTRSWLSTVSPALEYDE